MHDRWRYGQVADLIRERPWLQIPAQYSEARKNGAYLHTGRMRLAYMCCFRQYGSPCIGIQPIAQWTPLYTTCTHIRYMVKNLQWKIVQWNTPNTAISLIPHSFKKFQKSNFTFATFISTFIFNVRSTFTPEYLAAVCNGSPWNVKVPITRRIK